MTTPRPALALAAALAAAVSTSACSFTGTASAGPTSPSPRATSSARTATSTTTSTTTTTRTSRPTSGPGSGTTAPRTPSSGTTTRPASGGGSRTPRCGLGQLHVSEGGLTHTRHDDFRTLVLRNTGAPCHLKGWPGVDGIRVDGSVVHATRSPVSTYNRSVVATIVLRTGDYASSFLRSRAGDPAQAGSNDCAPDLGALVVTPPDLRTSARIRTIMGSCGELTVGPLVAGIGG